MGLQDLHVGVSMPKYKGLCLKMCLKIEGVGAVNLVTRVSNFL